MEKFNKPNGVRFLEAPVLRIPIYRAAVWMHYPRPSPMGRVAEGRVRCGNVLRFCIGFWRIRNIFLHLIRHGYAVPPSP